MKMNRIFFSIQITALLASCTPLQNIGVPIINDEIVDSTDITEFPQDGTTLTMLNTAWNIVVQNTDLSSDDLINMGYETSTGERYPYKITFYTLPYEIRRDAGFPLISTTVYFLDDRVTPAAYSRDPDH